MNNDEFAPILKTLADNGGAVLCWQLPKELSQLAECAAFHGAIDFDQETDLFVHPLAIKDCHGGYSMPKAAS